MIEIPTIAPWMIQIFTALIMIFVTYKILKTFEEKLGINFRELLNFNPNSYDNLKRKEAKLKEKRDRLADEVKLKTKIEDHKEDIARYKKAKEELK